MFNQVKSTLIELQVQANSTGVNFTFDQQQFLLQKDIISLETFTVTDMPISPLGNILPTAANILNSFLTLYGSNPQDAQSKGEWLIQIPLITLHRINNGTDPYVWDLYTQVPRNIVWEKSKVTLATGTLGNASTLSFVFNVGYSGNLGD
jgi:hypothetical protein